MSDEITARTQAYPNAELVLDVKTLGCVADYLLLDWNNYRLYYLARPRLVDVKRQPAVAKSTCHFCPEYGDDMPSYKALSGQQRRGSEGAVTPGR